VRTSAALHNPGPKSRAQMPLDESLFSIPPKVDQLAHLDQRISLAQDRATKFAEILLSQVLLRGKLSELQNIAKTAATLANMLEQEEQLLR
jgi:hypothetical protein